MTDKRLFLAIAPLALLAACGGGADEGAGASGEVVEGTISDAMLPIDRVRSEPPLEDPEAFAETRKAAEGEGGAAAPTDAADPQADPDQVPDPAATDAVPAPAPTPEPED